MTQNQIEADVATDLPKHSCYSQAPEALQQKMAPPSWESKTQHGAKMILKILAPTYLREKRPNKQQKSH